MKTTIQHTCTECGHPAEYCVCFSTISPPAMQSNPWPWIALWMMFAAMCSIALAIIVIG